LHKKLHWYKPGKEIKSIIKPVQKKTITRD